MKARQVLNDTIDKFYKYNATMLAPACAHKKFMSDNLYTHAGYMLCQLINIRLYGSTLTQRIY